ncbi:MAG: Kelch repeat-containing protein, partial [Bacteroidota bacterium]
MAYSQTLTGTWKKKASIGGTGRHRGVGGNAWNRGYLGLGHVNGAGADISFKDWWEYNPATDGWTQKADYPVANHGAVSFTVDHKIYVGGGSALTNQFYVYDPLTNSWNSIAPCPLSPGDIQGFSADGKGYVVVQNQLAAYDPMTNTWELKANLPINASNWSCTFSNESSGFIKIGHALFEYKPLQDQWISRASHPGLSTGGSYGFSLDGIGYVATGYVGGLATVTEEVWSFNPGSNSWNRVCDFPGSSRRFFAAFSIGTKGYLGLGTNGINLNDFWEFDPSITAGIDFQEVFQGMLYPNPATTDIFVRNVLE